MDKMAMIRSSIKQFSLKRFSGSLLQVFGVLWLLIEATAYFFSDRPWAATITAGWWLFLLTGMAIGVYRA